MADNLFNRTGVRYEVACDIIGSIIAHHAEVIGQEREKPQPDEGVIQEAEGHQRRLRDLRENLDAKNAAAIEDVIATYGPEARRLYGE